MSSPSQSWPSILTELLAGRNIGADDAREVMVTILHGDATAAQIAGFLVALRAKGETVDELTGLLDGALDAATLVPLTDDERGRCVDIVGTGGDGSHSINVSTMAAFVIAGAGVPVCKHGNRSASSKCGSADLLELLGVAIELHADGVAACVREAGIGFCFAPVFHPAFRFAGPPRREIGVPTAFNLLGPMANPGRVRRQVIGVADPDWGQEPKAIVVLKKGEAATPDEIMEFCRQRLSSFKRPRYVAFVDELPRTSTGKILKRILREQYGEPKND